MRRPLLILAVISAALVAALGAYAARSVDPMGRSGNVSRAAFKGYYDGHKVTFLSTDVSDPAEAREMHVNYAPLLGKVPDKALGDIYLVQGRHAVGQIPVFSSEPGDKTYSPLWDEVYLTWKAGQTPELLVKDDQIEELVKAGKLVKKTPGIVLNCPIVKPTKSSLAKES